MKVKEILDLIALTSSRNAKIAILEEHKDNQDLKTFFQLALESRINFYIRKIPSYVKDDKGHSTLKTAMECLDVLSSRKMTGKAAVAYLTSLLSYLDPDDAKVIELIIKKNPECGVASETVNKVWGAGTVFDHPLMKATQYDEKSIKNIDFPAFSQTKVDAAHCSTIVANGSVLHLSSNGLQFHIDGVLDDSLLSRFDNQVVDGELCLLEEDGSFMPRKKCNGILNKAIHGNFPEEYKHRVVYVVFDLIPYEEWLTSTCTIPYHTRWNSLIDHMRMSQAGSYDSHGQLRLVGTVIVDSEKEAYDHFKKLYDRGEEGTILKDFSTPWENKRSKYQIKYKGVLNCDLIVTGYNPGKGKYKGMIGSLICETSDGLLTVSVSGMSDDDRQKPAEFWIDKIVELAYNEVIKDKTDDSKWSLFLPRMLRERFDKNEADTFDLVPKQKNWKQ